MVLRFLLLDHSYKGEHQENLEGHEKNVMLLLDSKAASERSFISCGTLQFVKTSPRTSHLKWE
nr:unnamed protein product [Callosobruchus analis]